MCRLTPNERCAKPNPWNVFQSRFSGRYNRTQLSSAYKDFKGQGETVFRKQTCKHAQALGLSTCFWQSTNKRPPKTRGLDTDRATNLVVYIGNRLQPPGLQQVHAKWETAYITFEKLKRPVNDNIVGASNALLRQAVRIIDRVFWHGILLKHLFTFNPNGQRNRIYYNIYFDNNAEEKESLGGTGSGGHRRLNPPGSTPPVQKIGAWLFTQFYPKAFHHSRDRYGGKGHITNDGFAVRSKQQWLLHVIAHEVLHAVDSCVRRGTNDHDRSFQRANTVIYGSTGWRWEGWLPSMTTCPITNIPV